MPIHAQIELDFPDPACEGPISPKSSKTLQDLLVHIAASLPRTQLTSMLNTTASHLSHWLGKPPTDIPIRRLIGAAPEFSSYLRQCHFKPNSVRSYLNYLRILIKTAQDLGWREQDPELERLWRPLLLAIPTQGRKNRIASIPRYALQMGIRPADFGESHLNNWSDWLLKQGRTLFYVSRLKSSFRTFVFQNRFSTGLSEHPVGWRKTYGTPFESLPESLRLEIEQLLKWKVEPFSAGRPKWCRHRPVTARNFRNLLCRIHGFQVLLHGQSVSTLEQLLSEDNLRKYVEWMLNERRNIGHSFIPWLSMLYSSLRRYPPLNEKDFSWLPRLIEQVPTKDAELLKQEAKERKWVNYDTLSKIPEMLRRERIAIVRKDSRRAALLCRNELLIIWLLVLPWRQKNLRECKLADRGDGGNLFKSLIPNSATIAKFKWVEEKLKSNPSEEFWQFFFRPNETKTGQQVHSLLPKQLIPILEEYLNNYRRRLVKGSDPHTLFLNDSGKPITLYGMFTIIGNITYRYAGRRVNPHLFRDIFAVKYLEDNPKDYHTLSKLLWHRNVQTTLKVYGRNFDESHGVRAVEEWLEKRSVH
jgi:integrase